MFSLCPCTFMVRVVVYWHTPRGVECEQKKGQSKQKRGKVNKKGVNLFGASTLGRPLTFLRINNFWGNMNWGTRGSYDHKFLSSQHSAKNETG